MSGRLPVFKPREVIAMLEALGHFACVAVAESGAGVVT